MWGPRAIVARAFTAALTKLDEKRVEKHSIEENRIDQNQNSSDKASMDHKRKAKD